MIHIIYLSVVFSYEIYLEVEEGEINQTLKDENIFDFWIFRYLLSNQMIKYNPTHSKYAGDKNMRPTTHHNQATIEKINCY